MFELKPISKAAIPEAIAKAEKYRLLNEPRDAESICRDVLRADPDHQHAVVLLVLSLSDQFGKGLGVHAKHAVELLPRIEGDYDRVYWEGLIYERWAKKQFDEGVPGFAVYDWMTRAMDCYEKAEAIRPPGNDDAILRWNTCARIIKRHQTIRPKPEDVGDEEAMHRDDVHLG